MSSFFVHYRGVALFVALFVSLKNDPVSSFSPSIAAQRSTRVPALGETWLPPYHFHGKEKPLQAFKLSIPESAGAEEEQRASTTLGAIAIPTELGRTSGKAPSQTLFPSAEVSDTKEREKQRPRDTKLKSVPTPVPPVNKLSTIAFGEKFNETPEENEYRRGLITVGIITLIFASYSPALHVAFSGTSSPPPVLLLNAAVSVVALTGIVFAGPLLEATTPLPSSLKRNLEKANAEDTHDAMAPVKAGLELGLWKFLGTTANLYGLSLTTADHGAFLIQLTTLIVPVVQGIMGVPIPRRIVGSIALALSGVFLFTQEGTASSSLASNVALGDALCVLAAVFYATYDLRMFQWGKRVETRPLITNKIAAQALFSVLLLIGVGWEETMQFFSASSDFMTSIVNDSGSVILLTSVILWSGLAVNSFAPFIQVGGQQAVGPTRAQTLYASQPLWAATLSYFFLGETVGIQGFIGGFAFLAALFLAATADAPDPDCGKEACEV